MLVIGAISVAVIIYLVLALSSLNDRLFKHPLAVSNATRDIRGSIIAMHRSMKDATMSSDDARVEADLAEVQRLEALVLQRFELIDDRFLGDHQDLETALQAFRDWRPIREEVIQLVRAGQRDAAADITRGKGAAHVDLLMDEIQDLMDFANAKAAEFHTEAKKTRTSLVHLIALLSVLVAATVFLVLRDLRTRIVAPLQSLAVTASALAEGDFSVRNGYRRNDEVGELSQTVDTMAERIQKSQAALEDRYLRIFETAAFLITSVDAEGILVDCNQQIEPVLGYTKDEIIGQSMGTIIHPDDMYKAEDSLKEILSTGYSYDKHYRMLRKNGELRQVVINSSGLKGPSGEYEHTICLIEDITDRVEAEARGDSLEAQLLQSQKMEAVGRLAGGIAHDFNNLLTGVNGNVELARMDLHAADPVHQSLGEITLATERAADLIRQLLMFSRKQISDPKVMDVNAMLDTLERMLIRVIGEDISLTTRQNASPATINIDPSQLDQIILNLAVNARDAMPDGGELVIETNLESLDEEACQVFEDLGPGDYLRLSVRDTGHGMTSETRARIFEPFFTTKPEGKGTGLGLATVFGIVRQNRGLIRVSSEFGQGATFHVYLPLVRETPAAIQRAPATGTLQKGSETILAVEDDAAVRRVLERALVRLGYKVLAADCGPAALDLIERDAPPIDLLVTDVVMPEMDGRELADRLQKKIPDLKVLFCSGYTEDIIAAQGVLDSDIHFLGKPYTPSDMAQKLRVILDG